MQTEYANEVKKLKAALEQAHNLQTRQQKELAEAKENPDSIAGLKFQIEKLKEQHESEKRLKEEEFQDGKQTVEETVRMEYRRKMSEMQKNHATELNRVKEAVDNEALAFAQVMWFINLISVFGAPIQTQCNLNI